MKRTKTEFKQTEIGTLPIDWSITKFRTILAGNIRHGVYKPKESSDPRGVRLLKMGDINSNKRISNQKMERVFASAAELERFEIHEGNLIFARTSMMTGGLGNCSIVVKHDDPIIFDGNLLCAAIDTEVAVPEFYLYYFKSKQGQNEIARMTTGTQSRNIPGSKLMEVNIPVLNKIEQAQITSILFSLDSKIELNQKMNKILKEMGKAIFKHWFINYEFPNEKGKPYKSSGGEMVYNEELGKEIAKGWEVKAIDEIADFLNGLALQKYPAEEEDDSLPVIKIRELKQGITDSSDRASAHIPEEYIVDDGDILFSWSGSLEVVIWTGGRGALNQHLFKVTSSTYPKWLYYYWILQYLPQYRHIAEGKATTMGHIQRHHLHDSLVLIPDNNALKKMDSILHSVIEKIVQLNVESRHLAKVRDSLLPKLMAGKIRVPVEVK